MRTTGIIRRVDELGRVVIPSEIRRTMRLRVGSELELYTENDALVIRRYSSVGNMEGYASECASALSAAADCTVLVADTEKIIAASGAGARDYLNRPVRQEITECFEERTQKLLSKERAIGVTDESSPEATQIIVPLMSGGDVHGGLIALTENPERASDVMRLTALTAEVFKAILQ